MIAEYSQVACVNINNKYTRQKWTELIKDVSLNIEADLNRWHYYIHLFYELDIG